MWCGRQNSTVPPGFPPLGIHTFYNALVLSAGETWEYDGTLLSWSGYVTWQRCKDFADVIEVLNQLTLSQLMLSQVGPSLPQKEGLTWERSSPAGLEAASCQELCICKKMNFANNHVSLEAPRAQIRPQPSQHLDCSLTRHERRTQLSWCPDS